MHMDTPGEHERRRIIPSSNPGETFRALRALAMQEAALGNTTEPLITVDAGEDRSDVAATASRVESASSVEYVAGLLSVKVQLTDKTSPAHDSPSAEQERRVVWPDDFKDE